MKRREFLPVLALPFFSGCFGEAYRRVYHPPGTRVISLHAWKVEPEEDAEVVESDDERIADIKPIQRLLQKVREEEPEENRSDYYLSRRDYIHEEELGIEELADILRDNEDRAAARFAEAADALNELPQYSHPEVEREGSYIRTDDTVVLVASLSEG